MVEKSGKLAKESPIFRALVNLFDRFFASKKKNSNYVNKKYSADLEQAIAIEKEMIENLESEK